MQGFGLTRFWGVGSRVWGVWGVRVWTPYWPLAKRVPFFLFAHLVSVKIPKAKGAQGYNTEGPRVS